MKRSKTAIFFLLLFLGFVLKNSFASYPEFFNSLAQSKDSQAHRVVSALPLRPGQSVADIGAGGGYFSVLMARKVGSGGKVFAVDMSPICINYIRKYVRQHGLSNVRTVLARQDSPRLPAKSVDLIFIRTVFHCMKDRVQYFSRLRKVLKPGGKIVIIDNRIYPGHSIKESQIIYEMRRAGFKRIKRFTFLKNQSFNIFIKR